MYVDFWVSLILSHLPRLCCSGSHQGTAGCTKERQDLLVLLLNYCPECDALEAKLKRKQRVFISLFFFSISGNAIFSSAPSDQASNATRLHSDVLNMMNAEMCDVKAKYERPLRETRAYADRTNALLMMQSA
jgi:hypothetical protein